MVSGERALCPRHPTLVWVKDAERSQVVDRESGESWKLDGTAAIVWEWMLAGCSREEICAMLALVESVSARDAEAMLARIVQEWRDSGLCSMGG